MPQMHEIKVRVYYQDTDAAGRVYHANFLNFAERGRSEYLRDLGFSVADFQNKLQCLLVTVYCEMGWHAPAFLDDELTVMTRVENIKRVSVDFRQLIYKEDMLLSNITIRLVCVNLAGKAIKIPEELLNVLD